MSDFLNRVRNVAAGRPASDEHGQSELPRDTQIVAPHHDPNAPHAQALIPAAQPLPQAHAPAGSPPQPQADLLGIGAAARRLAEIAAHAGTQTPLALGLVGQAGSGKSFALNRVLADICAFAAGSAKTQGSPFVARLLVARVDAAASGDPAAQIAAALYDALHRPAPDGQTYPLLAEEAAAAATDPAEAARLARERLADTRRRLDSEREALRDMNSRRARLAENVLYENAGSRIDAHARVNRNSIESRLRGFGFVSGDPVATYKDLVRDVAENDGIGGRIRAGLRAMWAFRGQTRLVVLALVFFAIAWGLGYAQSTQGSWLGWLKGQETLKSVVGPIEANVGWLGLARQAAIWAGILSLLLNVARAVRFMMPIFRGVSLFKADVDTRNRDLDSLIANQTQRVDDLAGEIEPLTRRASEAERRAALADEAQTLAAKSPFGSGERKQAAAFIASLAAAAISGNARAPARVVVAIDNLDALPNAAATGFMAQTQELLGHPAYVTILTAGEAGGADLSRFIDVPLCIGPAIDSGRLGGLVKNLLGLGGAEPAAETPLDATRSGLDAPLQAHEADMLESLAPYAANSPRGVKRYVAAYRIARGGFEPCGALAAALAIQAGATPQERDALAQALEGARDSEAVTVPAAPRINVMLDQAQQSQGSAIAAGDLRRAQALAAQWSF